ncbi:MAG: MFS transporter [Proteobacteria bacterium]|nr:MFS transporter [Pseudomonadota bacterium]MDA1330874.1 MFS transporter [Pseudomonadota bacterium]
MNKQSEESVRAISLRQALLVFLPFACGYFLSYLFRSINAVIAPNLISEFDLSASELGLLTSVYFLTFASLQIPIGVFLDRFGPRRVNATLLILASIGAFIFSRADSFQSLLLGRAFIGFGVAACLMSSIKMFSLWFPKEKLPEMTGRIMFIGGLGAISATAPVEYALSFTGWREFFLVLCVATVVASAIVFFLAPDRKNAYDIGSTKDQLLGALSVYRSPIFWQIALGSVIPQAFNMSVQGLWAGPWLSDVAGLDRTSVAMHLLMLGIATMLGFLFWGAFATRMNRRGIEPIVILIWATVAYMALQLLLVFEVTQAPWIIWIGWGLLGTSGSLAFSIISHSFPVQLTGRATTALNLLAFTTAFGSQWLFGIILNQWDAVDSGYAPEGYVRAFSIFLILQVLGFSWMVRGYLKHRST